MGGAGRGSDGDDGALCCVGGEGGAGGGGGTVGGVACGTGTEGGGGRSKIVVDGASQGMGDRRWVRRGSSSGADVLCITGGVRGAVAAAASCGGVWRGTDCG